MFSLLRFNEKLFWRLPDLASFQMVAAVVSKAAPFGGKPMMSFSGYLAVWEVYSSQNMFSPNVLQMCELN